MEVEYCKYETFVRKLETTTVAVGKTLTIVQEDGEGFLKEVLIVAPTTKTGFYVKIMADDKDVVNESYTNLNLYFHTYSEDILANDDGTYVYVAIRDIYFKKSLKIEIIKVTQTGGITFNRIATKIYIKKVV